MYEHCKNLLTVSIFSELYNQFFRMTGWGMFTNDDDAAGGAPPVTLLPSSLRDVWGEPERPPFGGMPTRPMSFGPPRTQMTELGPSSVPLLAQPEVNPADVTFQGRIEQDDSSRRTSYFQVEFNPRRSAVFQAGQRLRINVGDYVLTEADRGFDIGKVTGVVWRPTLRETKEAKMIVRTATVSEIQQLPQKAEREARALQLCQAKAAESGLPMTITGAEFQFDGKKLTFYYSATSYVDFCVFVRSLFKIFGTRIWMVWSDGPQPM